MVLTGAGCSTGSGIGDYRDEEGQWKLAQPVQHNDFVRSEAWRRRYWTRSMLGYPSFRQAKPNATHAWLAQLEAQGGLIGLITQNVDRLHQAAGHRNVIDLHGRLDRVICLDCGTYSQRDHWQTWLETHHPELVGKTFQPAPDGDAQPASGQPLRAPAMTLVLLQHCVPFCLAPI